MSLRDRRIGGSAPPLFFRCAVVSGRHRLAEKRVRFSVPVPPAHGRRRPLL